MNNQFITIHKYLEQLPIVSSHEHHMDTDSQQSLTLDILLQRSYVGWCSLPKNTSKDERKKWLTTIRANTYFVWLEKSICKIYGVEEITENNWDDISQKIKKSHYDSKFQWGILQNIAGYQAFVQDSYWNPGCNLSKDDMVYSAYRIDTWMFGFHPDSHDHNGTNPRMFTDSTMDTLEEYEYAIEKEINRRASSIVAFKCGAAYERDIAFGAVDREQAQRIFGKHPLQVSAEEKHIFGDYIFNLFVNHARRRDIPIQIHTGLAQLPGSQPLLLEPVVSQNPDVKFVLFHGAFPWIYEVAAMAHNHSNVYLDMCWLPLISTTAAQTALHMFLEILPNIEHISWGGDAWTSEESLGAAMAFRYVLANVLAEKLNESIYKQKEIELIAEGILYRNAKKLYKIM